MKKVYIEWYDAYTQDGWTAINSAVECVDKKYIVQTIGWLMDRNEQRTIISHSITTESTMGLLHIPNECIINFQEL